MKCFFLKLTLIFTMLFSGATLAQKTTIKLPTTDNKSSFNVTKSNNDNILKLNADGGFLLEGIYNTYSPGSGGSIPKEGTGARLMWYPAKSAFRAGYVFSTQWDDANIGIHSTAMGYCTTASGNYSTALGYYTTAKEAFSLVVGKYNSDCNDALFIVGNGTADDQRDYAMTVFRSGLLYVKSFFITSDGSLKENINPLKGSLQNVLKLQGVSFQWKDKKLKGNDLSIGFIANDVEKIYPEVVSSSTDGIRHLAYADMIPILSEAIKELKLEKDEGIEQLKKKNDELEDRLAKMEKILEGFTE